MTVTFDKYEIRFTTSTSGIITGNTDRYEPQLTYNSNIRIGSNNNIETL